MVEESEGAWLAVELKVIAEPSEFRRFPIRVVVNQQFSQSWRDLSVEEARALADRLHDLADEVQQGFLEKVGE